MIGKIKMTEHPIEIQKVVKEITESRGHKYREDESLAAQFMWTDDDKDFWLRVDGGDYTEFYQRYPLCKKDSIVEEVREELLKRSEAGIKKYGVTLDREDIDLKGWLTHLSEELMDATLYVKRALKDIETPDQSPDLRNGDIDIDDYWDLDEFWDEDVEFIKVGDLEEEDKEFERNMKAAEELKEANKEIEALKKEISVWKEVVDKLLPYCNKEVDNPIKDWWNTPACPSTIPFTFSQDTATITTPSKTSTNYTGDYY